MDKKEREEIYQFWLDKLGENSTVCPPLLLDKAGNSFKARELKDIAAWHDAAENNTQCFLMHEDKYYPASVTKVNPRTGSVTLEMSHQARKEIQNASSVYIIPLSSAFFRNINEILLKYRGKDTKCKEILLDVLSAKHEAMLSTQSDALSFIWGPPGTGKTTELVRIALENDDRTLAVATTNHAANNIYRLIKQKDRNVPVIKIGKDNKHRKETQEDNEGRNKHKIIVTTIAQIAMDFERFEIELGPFRSVLIDEAGTVNTPELIMLSLLGEKMVIAGDPRQLTAIENSENIIERSIYDILEMDKLPAQTQGIVRYLSVQHRMPEDIAAFISKEFYNATLKTEYEKPFIREIRDEKKRKAYTRLMKVFPAGMNALDTSQFSLATTKSANGSRMSFMNALLSVVTAILWNDIAGLSVGIITPYNAEAELLNTLLKALNYKGQGIVADTIHRFQGQARDIIIFDLTDSFPLAPGSLFSAGLEMNKEKRKKRIADMNRLINVAVSRTKFKFILIGDITGFGNDQKCRWKYNESPDGAKLIWRLINASEKMKRIEKEAGKLENGKKLAETASAFPHWEDLVARPYNTDEKEPVLKTLLDACSQNSLQTERKKRKALTEILHYSSVFLKDKLSIACPGFSRNLRRKDSDMVTAWAMRHSIREKIERGGISLTYYMSTMEWKTDVEETAFSDKILSATKENKIKLTVVFQKGAFRPHAKWYSFVGKKEMNRKLPEIPFTTLSDKERSMAVYGLFHSEHAIKEGTTYGCVIFPDAERFLNAFKAESSHSQKNTMMYNQEDEESR